ncbi:hypothetical protein L208DRAFT_1405418 [Tricholoma matsutake]|nr:hypothetical protein L208DRAFT_1405418 [Tricholoma matsutake 945]
MNHKLLYHGPKFATGNEYVSVQGASEPGSRQRQGNVVKISQKFDAKLSDLTKVSCVYGEKDNRAAMFTRDMLQNCTSSEKSRVYAKQKF